jgi:hypothetical protein
MRSHRIKPDRTASQEAAGARGIGIFKNALELVVGRDDVTADRRFELVPSSCAPDCPTEGPALRDRLRAASQAGAQILIIGGLHKMSTLVQLAQKVLNIQQFESGTNEKRFHSVGRR